MSFPKALTIVVLGCLSLGFGMGYLLRPTMAQQRITVERALQLGNEYHRIKMIEWLQAEKMYGIRIPISVLCDIDQVTLDSLRLEMIAAKAGGEE